MEVVGPASGTTQGGTSLGAAFDPRRNSLNLIRLLLAFAVLVDHCFMLGGFGGLSIGNRTGVGGLAVLGFFALSGFLVAGSMESSTALGYLRKRTLRIYPGFLVALVVTAFVIAPISWLSRPPVGDCTGWCAIFGGDGSVMYVLRKFALWPFQLGIAGTPADVPFAGVWNGPLWTLFFEFFCYLLLLGLALLGVLRHRKVLLAVTAVFWGLEIIVASVPTWAHGFNQFQYPVLQPLMMFIPVFLTGSVLWAYRDRVPFNGGLALLSTAAFVAAYWLPIGVDMPVYVITSVTTAAPLIAYPLIWLGLRVHQAPAWRRHDFSYGTYIYACPVQQLLVIWGFARFGVVPYIVATVLLTAPFALASWHFVESPALRFARRPRAVERVQVAA